MVAVEVGFVGAPAALVMRVHDLARLEADAPVTIPQRLMAAARRRRWRRRRWSLAVVAVPLLALGTVAGSGFLIPLLALSLADALMAVPGGIRAAVRRRRRRRWLLAAVAVPLPVVGAASLSRGGVPYHPRAFADAFLQGAVPMGVAATAVAFSIIIVYAVDFGLGLSAGKVCVEVTLLRQERIVDLGPPIDHVDHIVLFGAREGGSRAEGQ